LEVRYLDRAEPEKGRFRSFILTSLKFFVADEEDRHRAHKGEVWSDWRSSLVIVKSEAVIAWHQMEICA